MQITTNQTIAGYSALEVRNFVRKHQLTLIAEESAETHSKAESQSCR
jgi:hypothetical protein